MSEIVIATNNAGKLREIQAILQPFGWTVVSQRAAGFSEDVPETGTTFAENAMLKARAVHEALGRPVIADDSERHAASGTHGTFCVRAVLYR